MARLVLGTAQFGSAYGITNAIGRLPDEGVREILATARRGGIDTFDTAADYGDSQSRLGALGAPGGRYLTKFSFGENEPDADTLFAGSARTLGSDVLAGVMFHLVSDLADERAPRAIAVLTEAVSEGAIDRAGVSIYDEDDLELALSTFPDLGLLQLPGSIVDGRLLANPRIAELHDHGVEIYVRSAFLQGVLLAGEDSVPSFLSGLVPAIRGLAERARREGTTPLALALGFLRDAPVVDGVVVGATTTGELTGILDGWNADAIAGDTLGTGLARELLDPRFWDRSKE
jgi:aryl-alcohol dehydrogenase-like predicted oxidoreductase